MIDFPAWVTGPTKCDTRSYTVIHFTHHGIVNVKETYLTSTGWAKYNRGERISRPLSSINFF